MHLPFVQVTRFRLTLVGNFSNLAPLQKLLYTPLSSRHIKLPQNAVSCFTEEC